MLSGWICVVYNGALLTRAIQYNMLTSGRGPYHPHVDRNWSLDKMAVLVSYDVYFRPLYVLTPPSSRAPSSKYVLVIC